VIGVEDELTKGDRDQDEGDRKGIGEQGLVGSKVRRLVCDGIGTEVRLVSRRGVINKGWGPRGGWVE